MPQKSKTIEKDEPIQQPARRQLMQLAAMAGLGVSMGVSTGVQAQTAAATKKAGKVVKKTKTVDKKKKPATEELATDTLKKGKGIDIPTP